MTKAVLLLLCVTLAICTKLNLDAINKLQETVERTEKFQAEEFQRVYKRCDASYKMHIGHFAFLEATKEDYNLAFLRRALLKQQIPHKDMLEMGLARKQSTSAFGSFLRL